MASFFILLIVLSILLMVVGLFKPKWALPIPQLKRKNRKTVIKYYASIVILSLCILSGILVNWSYFLLFLSLFLLIGTLLTLFIGIIFPSKVFIIGQNQSRGKVALQYGLLLVFTFVLMAVAGAGMSGEESDPHIVGGEYSGETIEGKRVGEGKLENNRSYYEGDWKNNERNGEGTQFLDYGFASFFYEGSWKNDLQNGQGKQTVKIAWTEVVYEGEWKDGIREGYGKFVDRGGNVYEGEWVNDAPNGNGTFTFANGETYVGEVKDWQRHGFGKAVSADGEVMEGNWSEDEFLDDKKEVAKENADEKNDEEVAVKEDAEEVAAEKEEETDSSPAEKVEEDEDKTSTEKPSANIGTYHFDDDFDSVYEGEMKDGLPNGYGSAYFLQDGERVYFYIGNWKDAMYNGFGTEFKISQPQDLNDLDMYFDISQSGYYVDNELQYMPYENEFYMTDDGIIFNGDVGQTKTGDTMTVYYVNGNVYYEGEWENSSINGEGTIYYNIYPQAKSKEGTFKDGQLVGKGKTFYVNGNVELEGTFKEAGIFHGYGISGDGKQYHSNGQLAYEGEFKGGDPDGDGEAYYEDGTLAYEGEWKDGKFDGDGEIYYPSGKLYYEGKLKENNYHGKGTLYNENGEVIQKGKFKNGSFVE